MTIKITKDTKISEIIKENFMVLFLLKKYDMACAGCAAKNVETIEDCANTHNVDLNKLIQEINGCLKLPD